MVSNIGIMDIYKGSVIYPREYDLWKSMLRRADKIYDNVSVCDEWLKFSQFLLDIRSLDGYAEWYHHPHKRIALDKDLKGGKVYSKDTCQFVSISTNSKEAKARTKSRHSKPVTATKGGISLTFPSIRECARVLQLNRSCIQYCLNGKYKSTGGYTFK